MVWCHGAFGTPLLLLRSGIGPDSAFTKSPTKQVLKLDAVGQNLMDHLQLPVIYQLKKSIPNPTLLTGNVAFLNLNNNGLGGAPDLQLNFTPAAPTPLQRFLPPLPSEVMIFLPILVQPKSIGSLTLDGHNNPVIDPQYLSESSDGCWRGLTAILHSCCRWWTADTRWLMPEISADN